VTTSEPRKRRSGYFLTKVNPSLSELISVV
jgi:predicted HicB family RNase H-like nuclease